MKSLNKETFIFLAFCIISFFFHYSTMNSVNFESNFINSFLGLVNFFIHHTFKPIEVFFHEISHGIVTLFTDRKLQSLHLDWDGSGYVTHSGVGEKHLSFISFAGYFGAACWGYFIYTSSFNSKNFRKLLLVGLCLSSYYFMEDIVTGIILTVILSVFFVCWKFKTFGSYLLRFIGVFVIVSSIYSPTYLFNYSDSGDHIAMAKATMIPSIVWVLFWTFSSTFFLFLAFKSSLKERKIKGENNNENN